MHPTHLRTSLAGLLAAALLIPVGLIAFRKTNLGGLDALRTNPHSRNR